MVGVIGFEPTTTCSQSRYATRLRYTPIITEPIFLRLSGDFVHDFLVETHPKLPKLSGSVVVGRRLGPFDRLLLCAKTHFSKPVARPALLRHSLFVQE